MTTGAALVDPIASSSLVSQVTLEIRRSILAGRLHPGQSFSLRGIAEQLGVSLIPVREALRSLEQQGLVVTSPGRSAVVASLDPEELAGIYRLRRQIEPDLAAASSQRRDATHIDELRRLTALLSDVSLNLDEVYDGHHALHMEMLRPAASTWDLRILDMLWRAAERYVRLAFGSLDADPHEHHRRGHAHEDLVAVFENGNKREVRAAVLEHLNENESLAQRALAAIPD